MADDKHRDDEPSIEEILSSIRDIISDEDDDASAKPAEESPDSDEEDVAMNVVAKPTEDDDVLDLTEVADDNNVKNVPEEDSMGEDKKPGQNDIDAMFGGDDITDPLAGINLAHPSDDDLDVFDKAADVDDENDFNEANDRDGLDEILSSFENDDVVEEEPARTKTPPFEDDSDEGLLNQAASTATVSSLARLAENIAVSRTASGTTLEDIVRQLLRPMLKDWLDENLPDVIERLVAKELERLAEKASRK